MQGEGKERGGGGGGERGCGATCMRSAGASRSLRKTCFFARSPRRSLALSQPATLPPSPRSIPSFPPPPPSFPSLRRPPPSPPCLLTSTSPSTPQVVRRRRRLEDGKNEHLSRHWSRRRRSGRSWLPWNGMDRRRQRATAGATIAFKRRRQRGNRAIHMIC